MTIERANTSIPETTEKAVELKGWLDNHGIKAVLFDLDDTILNTNVIHQQQKERYKAYVTERIPGIDRARLDEAVKDAEGDAYKTHSVSLARFIKMADLVSERFPGVDSEIFYDGGGILLGTYSIVPEFFPDAEKTIRTFRAASPKLGIVTLANKDWTRIKTKTRGLDKIVDHIEIMDETGRKNSAGWSRAIAALGVRPEEALVVGDNILGDIRAARDAGVQYIVQLPSPWEEYRRGEVPENVISVDKIGNVIDALLKTP